MEHKYQSGFDILRIPSFCQSCRYEMVIKGERVFQVTQMGGGKNGQLKKMARSTTGAVFAVNFTAVPGQEI